MAYAFEQFCADCRDAIRANEGDPSREAVRQHLERLLANEDFVAEHCGPEEEGGFGEIYCDPDTDFRVLVHIHNETLGIGPHDHGSSWAVYRQAVGHTDMTVWRNGVADGAGEPELEPVNSFRLVPPQAGVFHPGDIHSIDFETGGRVIRVTGTDLQHANPRRFEAPAE